MADELHGDVAGAVLVPPHSLHQLILPGIWWIQQLFQINILKAHWQKILFFRSPSHFFYFFIRILITTREEYLQTQRLHTVCISTPIEGMYHACPKKNQALRVYLLDSRTRLFFGVFCSQLVLDRKMTQKFFLNWQALPPPHPSYLHFIYIFPLMNRTHIMFPVRNGR